MTPQFDSFIAIDWSGAAGRRYRGIAVAECGPGTDAPRLIPPPNGDWWSRTDVARWLRTRLGHGTVLAGFDFAFSFPFDKAGRYFPDPDSATAFDLWDWVDTISGGAQDFLGTPFIDHPGYIEDFWTSGPKPATYVDARRGTERVCARESLGSPQSPYHLIGSKQVGRGSLAGMRLLADLRRAAPDAVAFWPFQDPAAGRLVCVEIYPRLFLRRAGFGTAKVRAPADLDRCLEALGSEPAGLGRDFDDHEADAIVSAAGLRRFAFLPGIWAPADLDGRARRQEGWIFGAGIGQGPGK